MAYDENKLTKLAALKALANRVKTELNKTFKSADIDGNTVNFYTSDDKSGTAEFSFDLPEEMFLDQTKTAFVGDFVWSEATYPGSADPNLNGKPVMVLAVKGESENVNYSFLDMAKLVDTYIAKTEGKDASTAIEISGYEIEVKVNISQVEGNQLQLKADGLYVAKTEVEVASEAEVSDMLDEVLGTTA